MQIISLYSKLLSMCYNTRPTEVQFSETYPLQSAICMYVQSTVYTQIYIQIYIFVNREDGAWWNFTTFKWPHGQCSGKTGRYIHHCYSEANGGEELLYWPCPACHLRTILCCTLPYCWRSEGSDTHFFANPEPDPMQNSFSCFAKIQIVWIGRPFVKWHPV